MLLRLFLCNILLIYPIVTGVNMSSSKENTSISLPPKDLNEVNAGNNITKINGLSEGGPIRQTTQTLESPKESLPALLSLDTELDKDKSAVPSNSKVVGRKGVMLDYKFPVIQQATEMVKDAKNVTASNDLKNSVKKTTEQKTLPLSPATVLLDTIVKSHNDTQLNDPTSIEVNTNKTQGHRTKPLILSGEALANMPDTPKDDLKIPAIQSSRQTLVADQIQLPRIQVATRHPGIVMPIVITILVVPMFAVLGYMALKRGREAWKNRHYKRMDFLLDGMYND